MSQGLKFFTDLEWPIFALIIFIVGFFTLIFIQIKLSGDDNLKKIERLPLEGDQYEF